MSGSNRTATASFPSRRFAGDPLPPTHTHHLVRSPGAPRAVLSRLYRGHSADSSGIVGGGGFPQGGAAARGDDRDQRPEANVLRADGGADCGVRGRPCLRDGESTAPSLALPGTAFP